MAITLGGLTFPSLMGQPVGYAAADVQRGFTARQYELSGLLRPADWVSLLTIFDSWQSSKAAEEPPERSQVVGATVAAAGTANGVAWNAACWFASAPSGEQRGAFVLASVTLVDAAQQLAVILRQQEDGQADWLPSYGTWTLGTVTLTLTRQPVAFDDGPTLKLSAAGAHYLEGPPGVTEVREIEGRTTAAGWASIQTWYQSAVASTPAANAWFPVAPPTATAELRIVAGAEVAVYTVSARVVKVRQL